MTPDTPVRIASTTKTFVAAAILRLWEQGLLDLDAPINVVSSQDLMSPLSKAGYETGAITIRQLLMHTSGMNDHFGSDEFRQVALSDPSRVWTRLEQVTMMAELTEKHGPPGSQFAYSDTGYLLLGDVLEQVTGKTLADAVRDLNRMDALGLGDHWWEEEAPQEGLPRRAHQYLEGMDTHDFHGSIDAFGGGGLLMSVETVAQYFEALFNGEVFANSATLKLMTTAPGHPINSPYRFGVFTRQIGEHHGFAHGGFWGTDVVTFPELDLTVAAVTLDQSSTEALYPIAAAIKNAA